VEPLTPLLEVERQDEGAEESAEHEEGEPGPEERSPAEGDREDNTLSGRINAQTCLCGRGRNTLSCVFWTDKHRRGVLGVSHGPISLLPEAHSSSQCGSEENDEGFFEPRVS